MHAILQISNSSFVLKHTLHCGRSHKIPRNYSESCDCNVKYGFSFYIQAICESVKNVFLMSITCYTDTYTYQNQKYNYCLNQIQCID